MNEDDASFSSTCLVVPVAGESSERNPTNTPEQRGTFTRRLEKRERRSTNLCLLNFILVLCRLQKDATLEQIRGEHDQLQDETQRLRTEIDRLRHAHETSVNENRALKVRLDEQALPSTDTSSTAAVSTIDLVLTLCMLIDAYRLPVDYCLSATLIVSLHSSRIHCFSSHSSSL